MPPQREKLLLPPGDLFTHCSHDEHGVNIILLDFPGFQENVEEWIF